MSLLEQFDYLRNNDPQKRLAATIKIFSILDLGQKKACVIETTDEMLEKYGADTQYTFTRLIKGLASSRESARLGFSAALSELLRALPGIDTNMVLKAIEKATTPSGNIKGQEARDYQFGRLFGCQALCTSGLLARPATTMEEITPIFGNLFELAMSKGWLRESCANVIIQILVLLAKADSAILSDSAELVHEMLYTSELSKTMEGIALALKCIEYGSKRQITDWKHGKILHADNLSTLNKIMRDLSDSDEAENADKQTGTWKPKLHFTWILIIRAILADQSNDETIQFSDFWRVVVDQGLFSINASHERKFWGFQLFNYLIEQLQPHQVHIVFTPNFLRTLSNQIAQFDRYLNKAAKNTTAAMVSAAKADGAKAIIILTHLWTSNLFFDRVSKDKTCESIMVAVEPHHLDELVELLLSHLNPPAESAEPSVKEVEKRRQFVADSFMQLLRTRSGADAGSWIDSILEILTFGAFYQSSKAKKSPYNFSPELSDATREMFRARLQSSLGSLMPTTIDASCKIYSVHVIKTINAYKTNKYFTLLLQPDEAIESLIQTTEKRLTKLEKKRTKESTQSQALAFLLLYSLTLLQVYSGEPDAVQILEDLDACYTTTFSKTTDDTGDTQDAMETLIDLLLGFLSRESVLFRRLVEAVFTVFVPSITERSLNLLLNVLAAEENGQGLFDETADLDGESNPEDDEEEDEAMIDADEAARAGDDSASNSELETSSDDDDDDDDEEDHDEERNLALEAALEAALGSTKRKASKMDKNHSHESDFEADDDEEDLMDDDQMLAMDATLENIFKRRKQENPTTKKQTREELKTSTLQLKRKVLDLLEILIKHGTNSQLNGHMIMPILQMARKTSDTQLAEKAQNLIKAKLTKVKSTALLSQNEQESMLDLLPQVHAEAARSHTPPQLASCSQCSLFLVRSLLTTSEDLLPKIVDIYAQTQIVWMTKKNSKLAASFFVDFLNWSTQWRSNKHKPQKNADIHNTAKEVKTGPRNVKKHTKVHKSRSSKQ